MPLRLRAPAPGDTARLEVADLSDGGLCFRCPVAVAEDSEVDLEIPIGDRTFRLSGTVVHCGGEPGDGFRVGVAFRAPSMRFRAKLAEQLLRIEELERTLRVSREEAARRWAEEYAAEFAELYEK